MSPSASGHVVILNACAKYKVHLLQFPHLPSENKPFKDVGFIPVNKRRVVAVNWKTVPAVKTAVSRIRPIDISKGNPTPTPTYKEEIEANNKHPFFSVSLESTYSVTLARLVPSLKQPNCNRSCRVANVEYENAARQIVAKTDSGLS